VRARPAPGTHPRPGPARPSGGTAHRLEPP
jgi:hypothetical protein